MTSAVKKIQAAFWKGNDQGKGFLANVFALACLAVWHSNCVWADCVDKWDVYKHNHNHAYW